MTKQPCVLDEARRAAGLTHGELWFRYFELGGMGTALEVEAYVYQALVPSDYDGDLIVTALNERFFELGGGRPVSYVQD